MFKGDVTSHGLRVLGGGHTTQRWCFIFSLQLTLFHPKFPGLSCGISIRNFWLSAQINLTFFLITLWTLRKRLASLNADVTAIKNTRWVFALFFVEEEHLGWFWGEKRGKRVSRQADDVQGAGARLHPGLHVGAGPAAGTGGGGGGLHLHHRQQPAGSLHLPRALRPQPAGTGGGQAASRGVRGRWGHGHGCCPQVTEHYRRWFRVLGQSWKPQETPTTEMRITYVTVRAPGPPRAPFPGAFRGAGEELMGSPLPFGPVSASFHPNSGSFSPRKGKDRRATAPRAARGRSDGGDAPDRLITCVFQHIQPVFTRFLIISPISNVFSL